jgi:hypothetical protein
VQAGTESSRRVGRRQGFREVVKILNDTQECIIQSAAFNTSLPSTIPFIKWSVCTQPTVNS